MKINKLELRAFGKFRDHAVDLHDGLNILYAPNETGKSTLAGFIRYMLYGFPKNERSSASNPITTAQRFKPWQGGEVGGSMVVTVDGRRITVVREGAKSVRLYDSVTMTEIPMTREPGEEWYGLTLDTFESTAFFGQSSLSHVSMDQLEDKLKNMVTGADESVSYEKARDALHKARNKINSARTGLLPALRREEEDLLLRIEQAKQEQEILSAMAQACEELSGRLTQAERDAQELAEKTAVEQARIEDEFADIQQQLRRQIDDCAAQQEQAYRRLGGMDRRRVDDLNGMAQRLLALRDVLGQIEPPVRRKKPIWLLLLGVITVSAGLALAFVLSLAWLILIAAAGLIPTVVYAILSSRIQNENRQSQGSYEREMLRHQQAVQLQQNLSQVFGDLPDYTAAISERYDDLATVSEQQARIEQLQVKLSALDLDGYRRADAAYAALQYQSEQLSRLQQQLQLELAQKKAQWEERSRHVGAVDTLQSALNEKQERIAVLEKECAAYDLALTALDDAHLEMTHLYAPMLADRTAEFFSTMTGDTDRRVAVDVGGKVRVEEKEVARNLHFYSVGTADAVYVSLRLALIDMLYAKQKPTLVFDDSFSNFDEGRAAEMLRLLGKLGQKTQVLYFTCRDPKPLLRGIDYHNITDNQKEMA